MGDSRAAEELFTRTSYPVLSRRTVRRLGRQLVDRIRGQQNIDHLVTLGLEVGERAFIARNAYIDPGYPWLITIGEEATVGPRTIVLAHDASMQRHIHRTLLARVTIGDRAFIGAGAIVLAGSTVGDNAVIGAGSVVRGNVPAGSLVIGNPARVVSDVESMLEKHTAAASEAPTWPHQGWTLVDGITRERMDVQRAALASGAAGYLEFPERISADGLEG